MTINYNYLKNILGGLPGFILEAIHIKKKVVIWWYM